MRGAVLLFVLPIGGCSLVTDLGDLRGSVDGGGEGSVDDAGGCFGSHLVCENFNGDAWAAAFGQKATRATMTISTDDFMSPPSSLRVAADGGGAVGYLLATFPSQPNDFTCSVYVRIEGFQAQQSLGYYNRVSPIVLYDIKDPSLADYELTFLGYAQTDGTMLSYIDEHIDRSDAATADNKQSVNVAVEDDTWHQLIMSVHLGTSPTATMQISPGGKTITITPPSDISNIAFAIGVENTGSNPGGWVAHFDDAVCDATP